MQLALVIPCFNEAEALPVTAEALLRLRTSLVADGLIDPASTITFVDDGSMDATWHVIDRLARENAAVHGLRLSRNYGHQQALLAGLLHVSGDAMISLDADLQDDVAAVPAMLRAARGGADVVYGVRRDRSSDPLFKRASAQLFYRMLQRLGVSVVYNHADFRLLSRRAVEALRTFPERNLFLRGLIPQLGFPSALVYYDRAERVAGASKYPLRRMISFAVQGITSFSAFPLRIITVVGLLVALGALAASGWVIWERLWNARVVPGWASTLLPIFFLGGVQMLSLGVIGEYVAKIYMETKRRPRYIVQDEL